MFDLVADVERKYGNDGGFVYTLALLDNKKIKPSTTHGAMPVKSAVNDSTNSIPQNHEKSRDLEKTQSCEKNRRHLK